MSEVSEIKRQFTQEKIEAAIQLWLRSSISLVDVRSRLITRK